MYRNILLCYDGSEEGINALKEGADVALAMNAHTHLLAILRSSGADLSAEPLGATHLPDEHQQAAMRILREGVEWLKARNLDAQGQLVFGDPVGHIATCARSLGCDLVVVGHRHRSRLARWWSEAEEETLLERAPCSILVALGKA
ncbi:universal stress protein [Massilia sp. R2A-15]|uniref:universal stress protein n=1 Tax=Massilia sp. R2A-15 TaxID=3064278 RepID=UPI0027332175|nr:universal stress protein [Massilia sp. R2A-15]WLI91341.1 universal stress protein [Massilia sp. R2A-15]